MNFSGEERFEIEAATVWSCLADMEFVSRAIPDVEKVTKLDATGFSCRVRPRFSFLSGTLDLTFEISGVIPPKQMKIRSRGKGIGAAVVVEAEVQLSAEERATRLHWTGMIVSREGLLKPIGASLIQGAAQRVIDGFWKRFREALPDR